MKKRSLLLIFIILLSLNTLHAQIVKGYGALGTNLAQVDGDEAYGFYKVGLNIGLGAEVKFSDLFSGSIEANFNQKGARKYMFYYGYNLRINYAEVPIMFHVTDNHNVKFGIGASYSRPVGTIYENDPRDGYGQDEYGNLYSFFSIKNKTDDMTTYKQFRDANDGLYDTEAYAEEYYNQVVLPWNAANNKFAKNNFSLMAEITFPIWRQIKGNIRYSYTITTIRKIDYYFYNGINFDNTDTKYELYDDGGFSETPGGQYYKDYFEAFSRNEHHNCLMFRLLYYFNEKQADKNKEAEKAAKEKMNYGY